MAENKGMIMLLHIIKENEEYIVFCQMFENDGAHESLRKSRLRTKEKSRESVERSIRMKSKSFVTSPRDGSCQCSPIASCLKWVQVEHMSENDQNGY